MLILTERHLQAFAREAEEVFLLRLVRLARAERLAGAEPLSDDELAAAARESVARARGWGIDRAGDLTDYFKLALAHGRDFDRSARTAWAGDALRSAGLDGHRRLLKLLDAAFARAVGP